MNSNNQNLHPMKKILIYTLPVFLLAIFGLYYWQAEHRVGPPIKNIHLAAFDVKGITNPEEYKQLSIKISEIEGVTACNVNEQSKIASITFYPDMINEALLQNIISVSGNCKVSKHVYDEVAGCPVNIWRSWAHSIFSFTE